MDRIRGILVASLLLGLLVAGRAGADVRYLPPSIEWAGPIPQAEPGKALTGAIRICMSRPATVADVRIEGDGWSVRLLDPRASWSPTAGRTEPIGFEATPADPTRPLTVTFTVDGVRETRGMDISPAHFAALRRPGRLERLTGAPPPRLAPAVRETPCAPVPPVEDGTWAPTPAAPRTGEAGAQNYREMTVTGQLAFERPDHVTVGADGVTVRVWNENLLINNLMGTTTTGTDGTFSVTFGWDPLIYWEEWPDIFIEFEAASDHALTRSTDFATWGYRWTTGTMRDFDGFDYDLGTWVPADDAAALCLQTDLVRAWRWFNENLGLDVPRTIGLWPDPSPGVSFYVPFLREVHITTGANWNEDTHVHEYGHGFFDWQMIWDSFDYCNGICDDSPTDCGHCGWCQEEANTIGFQEGFPDYLAWLLTTDWATRYGVATHSTREAEWVMPCGETGGTWDDPYRIENFTAALLQDITDSANEQDTSGIGQRDRLSMGYDEIFSLLLDHKPHELWVFVGQFEQHLLSGTAKWDMWATAENCRIERDFFKPPPPINLASPTHPVGSTSKNATPSFTWDYQLDDLSGPNGCQYSIEPTATMTTVTGHTGWRDEFTTGVIAPGTWYFHLRTTDNSGKVSDGYATYGPFTIQAPDPVNLQPTTPAGWVASLVPRPTNDATGASVPAPTSLAGNSTSTYWNVAGRNSGEQIVPAWMDASLRVDGAHAQFTTWSTGIGPGVTYSKVNLGPVSVRGGRHAFGVMHDANAECAESSETDNVTADQWMWMPDTLTAGTGVIRSAPPDRIGGWDALPPGHASWYNCDGYRFTSYAADGWWQAVYVSAHDTEEDYDCRLHFATWAPDTGFATYRAYSGRPAGCIDAVLVNRNTVPSEDVWDVGVLNVSGGVGNFTIRQEASTTMSVGDSVAVSIPTGQMLELREVYVGTGDVGPVSITARVISGPPVTLAWFDRLFTTGSLSQASGSAVSRYMTTARLDLTLSTSGYYALALYKDAATGTDWTNLVLEVERTPPDFVPYTGTGWHSSLVPRPAFDGTGGSVPAPDTLYGNVASTYLNIGVRNESPGPSPGFEDRLYLDGVYIASLYYPAFGAGTWSLYNWDHAFSFRGGRHTLSEQLDPFALVEEIRENNNTFGEQWVWGPFALTLGVPQSRAVPPVRTGGWSDVTTPASDLRYNCDGLRTPTFAASGDDGYWGALAVASGAGGDVDLRLYDLQRGTTAGFYTGVCGSAWGPGQTDLAVVNFNRTGFRAFDAGVVRSAGSEGYVAEAVRSTYRGGTPAGPLGPFTMDAQHLLHLHEFYLPAGTYGVTLWPMSGGVDWGVSVYDGLGAFYGKSDAADGGVAWLGDAGDPEQARLSLVAAGYCCVAVWKTMAADVPLSGSYRLELFPQTDAVGGPPPVSSGIASVAPNPFRTGTEVAFDLAAPAQVALEVFDVRGARVATLAEGEWPAGRHRVAWSGTGPDGSGLPSGLYLVRFTAGGARSVRKLVRIE